MQRDSARVGKMELLLGVIGACLGAGVGALIWGAVAYYANLIFGLIATLVCVLAGIGARWFAGGPSEPIGIIAALAGVAGIWGGTFVCYYAMTLHDPNLDYIDVTFSEGYATVLLFLFSVTGLGCGYRVASWHPGRR